MARVLTVFDRPDVLLLLRQALRERGHEVVLAADGEGAVECLAATRFDLVVVDAAMAVGDGWSVVDWLERREAPVGRALVVGATDDRLDPRVCTSVESGPVEQLVPVVLAALGESN